MAVKTLTYILLGRDELSPVMRKAGANVEGTFARLGKLAGMMGLTTGIAAIGYESVKSAISFQASMEKIHTQAGASQASIKGLSQEVLNLGMHAQQSPKQLADALYHLKSIGLDNVNAMKALRVASDLAAVGGADLESTTNALGGAWRSGIKGAESFGKTASTVNAIIGAGNMRMEDFTNAIGTGILPAARTFGVSLSSIGSALALMTDEGIPAEDAATRLRMSLSLLGAPSAVAGKWLAKIGLTGLELANTMRGPQGLVGAIGLLKDHLDKSGLSLSQQAILLSHAFGGGRSSSAILTLVNNLDVLKRKQDQVNKTTGNYADAVTQQRKTAQAQFAILKNVVDVMGIRLGTALLPPLTRFAQYLTGTAIPRMQDFGTKVMPVIKQVFGYFSAGLATIGKGLSMLPGPVKVATIAITALGIAMKIAAANPWTALAVALILAVGIIVKNWKTIGPVVHEVINTIVSSWKTMAGFLVSSFKNVQTFAVNAWHVIENNFFGKALIIAAKVWWAATKLVFTIMLITITTIFQIVKAVGTAAFKAIVGAWKIEWTILRPLLQLLGTVFVTILGVIGRIAVVTWKIIAGSLSLVWRNIMRPTIMALWTTFSTVTGFIIGAAVRMFGWVPGVGGKLKQAAKAFNTFRDEVNKAIGGVNGKTVGVNVKMTAASNPYPGGISGRAATGGQIHGYGGPTSDRAGLWALSDGEWVVRAKSAQKYGPAAMSAVNRGDAVIHHAAGGGEVSVKPGVPSSKSIFNSIGTTISKLVLDAAKSGLFGGSGAAIVAYARKFLGQIPYVWGGTSVPGGADCSGFTQSVYGHFGIRAPRTSEAQYSWVTRSGPVPGGLAFYVSPAGGAPPGHVAIVQDSNTVISQGGGMGPKLESLHFMPLMGTGVPAGGFPGGFGGGNGPAHPFAVGSARQIAQSLLNQFGWGNQWGAFNNLENREAGWNMTARNPSSGAYGMAQFINGAGEYAQYGGNWYTPLGQLTAMMNYIRQRYGSPNAAWGHEMSAGWYDKGGYLKPGWNLAYNGTGKPEPVGHNLGGNTYHININVTPLSRPADTGRAVVNAIKEYERGAGKSWRK